MSDTPETDLLARTTLNPADWMVLARRLERERDEALNVIRHCRMFIVERKGYIADEALERELIKQKIDALAALKGGNQ